MADGTMGAVAAGTPKEAVAAGKGAVAAGAPKGVVAAGSSVKATILGTAKAVVTSPVFGVVVLVGIIGYELWKGKKDSREIEAASAY